MKYSDRVAMLRTEGVPVIEAKTIAKREKVKDLLDEAERNAGWPDSRSLRCIIAALRIMSREV